MLYAGVSRLGCFKHKIRQLSVPKAEHSSGLTALFDPSAIVWLKPASISSVANHLRLRRAEAAGIHERAVARGMPRRGVESMGGIAF